MRSIFCLLSFFMLMALNSPGYSQSRGILHRPAPELQANFWINGDGKKVDKVKIESLKGKVVYLFFFQDWCPGCKSHGFPALKKVYKSFKDNEHVKFIAVQTVFEGYSFNTKRKLRENQLKYNLKIPFAHDDSTGRDSTMARYRSGGTPWAVIVDPRGNVVYNNFHLNPDKTIPFIRKLISQLSLR